MNYYQNNIRHVKGDTFSCGFTVEGLEQEIETAKFTCRDSANDDSNVLFEKTLNNGISQVEYDEENDIREYAVRVAPEDMGRVIGKQGRIAQAIRTLVKAAAIKANKRVNVEIIE